MFLVDNIYFRVISNVKFIFCLERIRNEKFYKRLKAILENWTYRNPIEYWWYFTYASMDGSFLLLIKDKMMLDILLCRRI